MARFFAVFLASVLSLVGLAVVAPATHADTPGVTTTILHNGSALQDDAVVTEGDTITVNMQYTNDVVPGSTVVIGFPEQVTVDESSLVVPPGNTAIESITRGEDGSIQITFADPWPDDVQQGLHGLNFVIDEVDYTEGEILEWEIDGEPITREVIIRDRDDVGEDVSNWLNKEAEWADLNQHVSVDENGQVVLGEGITEVELPYVLNVHTDRDTDRSQFTIYDELSEYLEYNEGSFSAQITTWDENGWNRETNEFDFNPAVSGSSFETTVDIPSPSQLRIEYTASVSPGQVEALREALQASYDALEGGYGWYGVDLGNTAIFGGDTQREGERSIGGSVDEPGPAPGPDPNAAFNKTGDWNNAEIEPDEEGNLNPPLEIVYTFTANLNQWNGEAEEGHDNHEDFELDRNVVIRDVLDPHAQWDTAADDFITVTGEGFDELTEATGFDGDATAFEGDAYVGQYAVVGQTLLINIGQEHETNVTIDAKAQITSVAGLDYDEDEQTGERTYRLSNNAAFYWGEDSTRWASHEVTLTVPGDYTGGINDPDAFSKSADGPSTIYVAPGETAEIDYTFVANGVDVTSSYIVDHRDPAIFDLSDLDEIQANISGSYEGFGDLEPEHFAVSTNDEGHLVIQLSEAGVEAIGDDVDNRLEVNIALTTVPFEGKQTIQIENRASLYGEDGEVIYWSEAVSSASSYGDEAEVRKSIYDSENGEWTQNLRLELDEDGNLISHELVYKLEFIPHGNYSGVTIIPVEDLLPQEVDFLGFVDAENVGTGEGAHPGPVNMGGNLEAVYNPETGTITVQNIEGELLVQEPDISAHVLVEVTEFDQDTPVTNYFGNSDSTYTPSYGYPLSINKVDSEDDEVIINDPDSRFQILDAEENVIIEDAFVDNGFLRVLDEDGEVSGLVVPEPGTYYVEETVAPEGYELSVERIEVVVNADGSSEQVTFPNVPAEEEPEEPEVSIIKGDGDPDAGTIDNDANTEDEAVEYEDGETRDIVINVENTGTEDLVNVELTDETLSGAAIESLSWSFPDGTSTEASFDEEAQTWTAQWEATFPDDEGERASVWAPGEEIHGVATLTLTAGEDLHTNIAEVTAEGAGSGIPVQDDDPYNGTPPEPEEPEEPEVSIIKGDGADGEIANDANTEEEAEQYQADETREIVILVENTGTEDLVDVVLTDETTSGDVRIENLVWTLPDGETTVAAEDVDGVLTATWDGPWAPGEVITGVASLTLPAGEELHTNLASVEAVGAGSGVPVEDEDPYNAVPPEEPEDDPTYAVGDYVWIDANNDGIQDDDEDPLQGVTVVLYDGEGNELDRTTTDERGRYMFDELPAGDYQVQFILTEEQAELYEFTSYTSGDDSEVDSDAGEGGFSAVFTLGPDNEFLTADEDYEYFEVLASEGIDPTWDAGVVLLPEPVDPEEPEVSIIKGDGADGEIANDANTEEEAEQYQADETREIVILVENTGTEDLVDVVLTDETVSGAQIDSLEWTLPNGETVVAEDVEGVLTATWDGPWAPGEVITGVASLTLPAGEELHTNLASVEAVGAGSGVPVGDEDPYNAVPPEEEPTDPEEPEVSIIKGDGADGEIVNDANTEDDAVEYEDGETREIVINVENTGSEDLVDVVLTDETVSGAQIDSLVWTAPDGTELTAEADEDGVLTATWDGPWAPGEVITGVASLTLTEGEELHTNLASVEAVGAGSGVPVGDEDPYNAVPPEEEPTDPEEPNYAVGDYVWIDSNGDGVQDEDEEPLQGVTVVLYDGEGNEIARTTTDENGRYLFDNLPAGDYQVQFILTEEQAELYEFTSYTSGDNAGRDSNAGEGGFSAVFTLGPDNEFLISGEDYEYASVSASGGIDPTWDAGVVLIQEDEPTPPPSEEPTDEPDPEPTPEPSDEPSEDPAPSEDPSPSEEPSEDPAPSQSPEPTESPEPTTSDEEPVEEEDEDDAPLATTGASVAGIALLALLLVTGGVALTVRNRRKAQL